MGRLSSTLAGLAVFAAAAVGPGCSLALDPGRHQRGIDGGSDTGTPDTGNIDTGTPDSNAPDTGVADTNVADTGTFDGGGTCAAGFQCTAPAPPGWNGPVVFISGPGSDAAPVCPGAAPATEFETRSGADARAASCGCTCDEPDASQLSCGAVTVRTASNCIIFGGTVVTTVGEGQCVATGGLPSTGSWKASSSTFSATGNCTPNPTETVPPVTYAMSHRGCGFGAPVACGAGVCSPDISGASARLCVWVDGDATCPAGTYSDRITTAEDVTDTRGCSECTCGAIAGSCEGEINVVSGCGGLPLLRAQIPVGGCVAASLEPLPHNLSGSFSATASCPASRTGPTGGTEPVNVRTVCCQP